MEINSGNIRTTCIDFFFGKLDSLVEINSNNIRTTRNVLFVTTILQVSSVPTCDHI